MTVADSPGPTILLEDQPGVPAERFHRWGFAPPIEEDEMLVFQRAWVLDAGATEDANFWLWDWSRSSPCGFAVDVSDNLEFSTWTYGNPVGVWPQPIAPGRRWFVIMARAQRATWDYTNSSKLPCHTGEASCRDDRIFFWARDWNEKSWPEPAGGGE